MRNSLTDSDAELVVIKLAKNAAVTKFSDSACFVEADGKFIKADRYESRLICEFNGKNTLADIIAKRLEQGDTSVFDRLLSLIEKLNSKKLLDPECAAELKQKAEKPERNLTKKELKPNAFSSFVGKILTSVPFLAIMLLLSLCTFFAPSLKGVNILTSITNGFSSAGGKYLFAIVFILIFLFIVLSLPACFAAADMISKGLTPHLELKFRFGLLYLSADSAQIIRKGRKAAFRHYAMLLLTPFMVSGTTSILWMSGISRPMMAIMNVIAVGYGIIMLSPVSNSPLSMLISFFIPEETNSMRYFRKRFIKDLFSFDKLTPAAERLIIISSLGLVWIYLVYMYFWNVTRSIFSYISSDLYDAHIHGETGSEILIAISLLLIILPLLAALVRLLIVVFGNIGTVVSTPLARMRDLAGKITTKSVPANSEIIEFLSEIPLFAVLNEQEIKELCKHIKLRRFMKNSPIVRQGDPGEHFYTIVSGNTKVVIADRLGNEKTVEHLSTGDSFGETALIEKGKRTASVITTEPTVVFEISKEAFEKFFAASGESRSKITTNIRLSKLLMSAQVFSFMSQKQITYLLKELKPEKIKSGETIFRQNDEGNKFYLIQEGNIHLYRIDNSVTTLDVTLGPGKFFGEMALVKNIPRTATAEAACDSTLYSLDKEQFRRIIGNTLFGGKELDSLINERAAQLSKEVLKSCSRK